MPHNGIFLNVRRILSDPPLPPQSNASTQKIVPKNNPTTDWSSFAQASRFDNRIASAARGEMTVNTIDSHQERSLVPQKEYIHRGSTRILGPNELMTGAIQKPPIEE